MRKEISAGVRICSSPTMVDKLIEAGQIQVLLVSEDIPYEERRQIRVKKQIVLTRQHCTDLGTEEQELRKYQPADRLAAGILQVCQDDPLPTSYIKGRTGRKGRILGVYSPIHRIGRTTLALKLGRMFAQWENVLYLNLEAYAGIGGYFQDKGEQDLSHLLYYARQDNSDISVRISTIVRQMGSLDYVPPMKVWTDLKTVEAKEWELFFKRLARQSVYETIILDIGDVVSDLFAVLKLCDWILFPYTGDVYAKAKMAQYQYMLKVLRLQKLDVRTIYINMDKPARQAARDAADELRKRTGKGRRHAEGGTAS
ncbi:MAG: hypothetical protein HFG41_11765 [Coprococcus sp.]|nr:hypothetical protein [Coprococcus sp.]